MDGVRCMESPAAGDAPHSSFRTLGPTLLVSMGYLDFGKWLVAVEAGSRFGYDLVLLVLLFNLSAILCQYLSSCIGIVTKKNLAEICHQEYDQKICVVLGLQAGLSLLTSEFTMDKRKAGMFNAYASGFTLVCFVLGLLVSHPKTPVNTNVMFPKLSGESAYSLMVLLGTNIIVHNFYTHSSVVQVNF
ncbi:Ethylene-insensitive protein 2 [Zea mays]|uniref:Ethylene-insensitive protein 2 n=1 Tax=Zea mays TaxID=4577 RepID=A0A1D6L0U7_MAIZE|nr:Ethylene-insensitive protein 2 [Zea mays]